MFFTVFKISSNMLKTQELKKVTDSVLLLAADAYFYFWQEEFDLIHLHAQRAGQLPHALSPENQICLTGSWA